MTEVESREYVADWLRQVPDFMAELGLEDAPDLAARLRYLGSGGRADVVFLGERGGIKKILKVTSDSAQAALSQAALEDEPMGVVPIYEVVETEVTPRWLEHRLLELPKPGEDPWREHRTWGVVEKFVVPIGSLRRLGSTSVAGESPKELVRRFGVTWRAHEAGQRALEPLVEEWRLLYAAALEWVEETCELIGSASELDLHEDNWGVDPETGELLLIDLGQCYAVREAAAE